MSIELGTAKYYQADCADEAEGALLGAEQVPFDKKDALSPTAKLVAIISTVFTAVIMFASVVVSYQNTVVAKVSPSPILSSAWASKSEPFSRIDPTSIGILSIDRPAGSKPGPILTNLVGLNSSTHAPDTPLPTNTWYQNLILGDSNNDPENKIFQIPYIIDAAGYIPGLRTHPCHLQANDRMVMVRMPSSLLSRN